MFHNRKRVILDRGPSWPDYQAAEPFVIRYYPLFGGDLAMWALEEGLTGIA